MSACSLSSNRRPLSLLSASVTCNKKGVRAYDSREQGCTCHAVLISFSEAITDSTIGLEFVQTPETPQRNL